MMSDIHICGACKQVYQDIDSFIKHVSDCNKRRKVTSIGGISGKQSTSHSQRNFNSNNNITDNQITSDETEVVKETEKQTHQVVTSERAESIPDVVDLDDEDEESGEHPMGVLKVTKTKFGSSITYQIVTGEKGKKFQCCFSDSCKFSSYFLKDLERHYRIHTGEKPFRCDQCDRCFNRSDKLRLHKRSHTGEKPYSCDKCSYASADRSSLVKHSRTHTDERPYKCQLCKYSSRNSSQLIVHLRSHTRDAPFKCQICSASFKINSDLKRHFRLHTGEKPYACSQCNYRCAVKGNLKMHEKLNHSNEIKLTCTQCDYSTSSKRQLKSHQREHSIKELKCDWCNYTTNSKSALQSHSRIHTDEKPYRCEICAYSCRQACNLSTHKRKKHPDIKETLIKMDSKSYEKHCKSDLANCQANFFCQYCDSSFVRSDSLRSHLKQHEKDLQPQTGAALAILQLQEPTHQKESTTLMSNINEFQLIDASDSCNIVQQEVDNEETTIDQLNPNESDKQNVYSVRTSTSQFILQVPHGVKVTTITDDDEQCMENVISPCCYVVDDSQLDPIC